MRGALAAKPLARSACGEAARLRSSRRVGKKSRCACVGDGGGTLGAGMIGGCERARGRRATSGQSQMPLTSARRRGESEKLSDATAERARSPERNGKRSGHSTEGRAHIKPDPWGAALHGGARRRTRRSRVGRVGTCAAWAPCQGGAGRRDRRTSKCVKARSRTRHLLFVVQKRSEHERFFFAQKREAKKGAGAERPASRLWLSRAASAPERTHVLLLLRR